MSYKSPCKGCSHTHDGSICHQSIKIAGTIKLRPWNSTLWGVCGGMTNDYNQYSGSGGVQMSFKPFDVGRDEHFFYEQENDCRCMFYVPSDNLEFLEWKYDESK